MRFSNEKNRELRERLVIFRNQNVGCTQKGRLSGIPFIEDIFDTEDRDYPCDLFGKHLVLKIVDELLEDEDEDEDEGGEKSGY